MVADMAKVDPKTGHTAPNKKVLCGVPLHKNKLHVFQDMLDKEVPPGNCKKGCSACCHQWVGVTYLEAHNALHHALQNGHPIRLDEVEELADKATTMSREEWFAMQRPCIFLDDEGACAVHPARPIACRAVTVASDPKECGSLTGRVQRYDTRKAAWGAYARTKKEHESLALSPYVAALPLMVKVLLDGDGPSALKALVDEDGLICPEKTITNLSAASSTPSG